ncbi:hypothetical protein C8R43DRAFT_1243703 [Mycena crocata]|nr:hypothetical protein C8R43DRAFT_1243703 [Mycena crocata]
MALSYNIADLPFNIDGPVPAPTKEEHGLFDTVTKSPKRPSFAFRGKWEAPFPLGSRDIPLRRHPPGMVIITAAPLGATLAIVHVLAVFLIVTLPFVVTLQSYRLAWAWLVASVDNGHNRPTPLQLGIIMKILHGANLPALWAGLQYTYGICSKKRTLYKPSLLRHALFVLTFALALIYGFVVLDIALSVASTTISFSQLNDYSGTWPQVARQINSSMCATTGGAVAAGINLCGLQTINSSYVIFYFCSLVTSNPFRFGAVVSSQAYGFPINDAFVANTGFFAHGQTAYNVLTCSVTVRNAAYTYFNHTFIVDPLSTTPNYNLDITRAIGAMTAAVSLSQRVPAAIDGAGLSGEDYTTAFSRELSRELIGLTASLYASAAADDFQSVVPILGSRLFLPILIIILVFIVVYCCLILFLTVSAVIASSASHYTMLARNRLAEPLTPVHTAYARGEPHRTWEQTNQRLFSAETGLDRLSVGPTTSIAGGLAFGVSGAVATPSA